MPENEIVLGDWDISVVLTGTGEFDVIVGKENESGFRFTASSVEEIGYMMVSMINDALEKHKDDKVGDDGVQELKDTE